LKKPEHFRRFTGLTVKVKRYSPVAGRLRFTGRIEEADDTGFVLAADGERQRMEFADVESARLVPDFGPVRSKQGRSRESS
jgi:ribosome maturation factor RimP